MIGPFLFIAAMLLLVAGSILMVLGSWWEGIAVYGLCLLSLIVVVLECLLIALQQYCGKVSEELRPWWRRRN